LRSSATRRRRRLTRSCVTPILAVIAPVIAPVLAVIAPVLAALLAIFTTIFAPFHARSLSPGT
jgi:hypothetical protein